VHDARCSSTANHRREVLLVEFRYFMVRVHDALNPRAGAGPDQLTGVVERVGGNEKRAFASSEELIRLVAGWSEVPPNLETGPTEGNP
jgi:hypothetical protein